MPPFSEQVKMVENINNIEEKYKLINELSSIKEDKENLYKEYKKSLISEIVSGEYEE